MSAEQTPDIETLAPLVRLADEWAAEGDEMSHWFASQVLYNAIDEARQALAPVLAAAVREAEQRALREAAEERVDPHDSTSAYVHMRDVRRWLRDRADRVAEPQHEAAIVKGCTCGPDGTLAECAAELEAGGWCPRAAVVRAAQHEAATSGKESKEA